MAAASAAAALALRVRLGEAQLHFYGCVALLVASVPTLLVLARSAPANYGRYSPSQ